MNANTPFTAQIPATRRAVAWATKAIQPLDPALLEMLRERNPEGVAKAEAHIATITAALPHLRQILADLEAQACGRCDGTGEYGGASRYLRAGRKYCFTCGGSGKTTAARRAAPKATPAAATATPAPAAQPTRIPEVPAGRYTVDGHHFKIDRPEDGKWAGYTFIRELDTHGNQISDVRDRTTKIRICTAVAADPQGTLTAYGKATGTCGKCQISLKDPESIARGIGPYCESDVKGISVNAVYRERKANPAAPAAELIAA